MVSVNQEFGVCHGTPRLELELRSQFTSQRRQGVLNGQQIGIMPFQYQVARRGDLLVEVEKTGYKSQFRQTSRKLSGLGIADVIGGAVILLPLIGLVSSGAWEQDPSAMGFSLDSDSVSPTPVPTSQK